MDWSTYLCGRGLGRDGQVLKESRWAEEVFREL